MKARAKGFWLPEVDPSVWPCVHMSARDYFFDALSRQQPFEEENGHAAEDCDEFGLDSAEDRACSVIKSVHSVQGNLPNENGEATFKATHECR